jgi:hypothetical protein
MSKLTDRLEQKLEGIAKAEVLSMAQENDRLRGALEKILADALKETLAEMEALMRTKRAYQGGLNIAERAKDALSLYNNKIQTGVEQ